MRFDRYPPMTVEVGSPQRRRAAQRFVDQQREKYALCPELMEDTDADERVAKILRARRESWQERRNHVAAQWRRTRRELAQLPAIVRAGVLAYWQQGGIPGSHEYLMGIVSEAQQGVSYWHKLAELRRLRLISQGRLPNPWRTTTA